MQRIQFVLKAGGHAVTYEKGPHYFRSFIHRCCALPFVPPERVREAMEVLQERAEKMEDEGHKNFANNMCQYIHSQWIEGPSFCVKDWNVFHVGFFN